MEPSAALNPGNKPPTAYSCIRCFERKVKCDRKQPCSQCEKHSAECVYRVPPAPRRRKKRAQEDILTERLRRYEQVLQQQGIDPSDIITRANAIQKGEHDGRADNQSTPDPQSQAGEDAGGSHRQYASSQLIFKQGRSRYHENNLWNRVTEEFGSPQDALDASSDDDGSDEGLDDNTEFVLAGTPSSCVPRYYHPPPDQVLDLWQIYLDNFDPLSKIIHPPTVNVLIQRAVTSLEKIPRNLEALMFAIYGAAVLTLQEQECDYQFGESRKALLSRYREVTKSALQRAKFLGTEDIVVLQAFVIHLLTMRDEYDSRTLWVLTGVAIRIAEGMGLHRDGSSLGLPVFESEIRRRVWWQLYLLDYRSAELSGSSRFSSMFSDGYGAHEPLNIDDDDLWPGMANLPLPQAKATDMMLCSMRYTFGSFWNKKEAERANKKKEENLWANYGSTQTINTKDAAIDELQQILQDKYLRFCDPSIPSQLMASSISSAAVYSMRLVAHHPRRYAKDEDMPESERQLVWRIALHLLEADNTAYTDSKLRRFIWHTSFYFQWQALIHVLDCLRAQPLMFDSNRAWELVNKIYENHPEFLNDTRKPLYVAVGTLCLKAYNARERALVLAGDTISQQPKPEYITKLRTQREAAHLKQAEAVAAQFSVQNLGPNQGRTSSVDTTASAAGHGLQQNQQQLSMTLPFGQHVHGGITDAQTAELMGMNTNYANPTWHQYHQQPGQGQGLEGGQFPQNPVAPQWFYNFGYQASVGSSGGATDLDPNYMLASTGNSMDANLNVIDWNQWDALIPGAGPRRG